MMQIESLLNLNSTTMSQPDMIAPPPVVICPTEVDQINVTLEKNQQCACKDCGKLFNSVWYLKQHAVKHSNDRPFRCKYCYKTYKFRSNLYQHKCPDRIKNENGKRLLCRIPGAHSSINDSASHQHNQRSSLQLLDGLCSNGAMIQMRMLPYEEVSSSATVTNQTPKNGLSLTAAEEMAPAGMMKSNEQDSQVVSVKQRLTTQVIDAYMQKYRNKVHQCRRCKLNFPSNSYLNRHNAWHADQERTSAQCDQCPQRFTCDEMLKRHSMLHSTDANIRCLQCTAPFRSMLALRWHRDQCRQCDQVNGDNPMNNADEINEFEFIDVDEANQNWILSRAQASSADHAQFDAIQRTSQPDDRVETSENHHYGDRNANGKNNVVGADGEDVEGQPHSCSLDVDLNLSPTSTTSIEKKKDDNENENFVCESRGRTAEFIGSEASANSKTISSDNQKRKLSFSSSFDKNTNGNAASYRHYSSNEYNHSNTGSQVNANSANYLQMPADYDFVDASCSGPCNDIAIRRRSVFPKMVSLKAPSTSTSSLDLLTSVTQLLHDDVHLYECVNVVRSFLFKSLIYCLVASTILRIANCYDLLSGEESKEISNDDTLNVVSSTGGDTTCSVNRQAPMGPTDQYQKNNQCCDKKISD